MTLNQIEIEYFCYVHSKANGIAGVIITDAEYPDRVAFSVISKLLQDFMDRFNQRWNDTSTYSKDNCMEFPLLEETMKKYQNPQEADAIMKIQKDLTETKTIMVRVLISI